MVTNKVKSLLFLYHGDFFCCKSIDIEADLIQIWLIYKFSIDKQIE